MLRWLSLCCAALLIGAPLPAAGDPAHTPLVVLISVDGMKPEAVLEAQRHGLKVPNLSAFMTDGAYAKGVRGVLPTLTYPSHTTLLTGASPARHGIIDNTTFDPLLRNQRGWYWYAEDVKVPTLWDAAAAAHMKTANVYWPVSVGARITFNLPQIWRAGTDDDLKLQRALSTPGLEQELSAELGRYPGGMEETVAEDEIRARFAIRLLQVKHPDFLTVYLTGLDTEEHLSGPFSPKSNQVLERLDGVVGALRSAAEAAAPGLATVCVVSDHGFAAIDHDVNLYAAFLQAGLFRADKNNKIIDWKAMLWPAGGSAAVILADPKDEQLRRRVRALLGKLAGDPANGIERIWSRTDIQAGRGFPNAEFLVSFKIGYEMAFSLSMPLVTPPGNLGMHGYVPERAEMRSSFFIAGPHVARGRDLGEIDMRQIAPTIAGILRVRLSGAEMQGLALN
ncbi:MAG TPA: ectonucleotide pyrophosphatase/phosphodiesterase [Steroidobacteraceae bacterium]|jgi:predicted AlkP superfamily pyrophosphatase or phosphodiesterase|nr:ectonucleotide pyrophosphatase/phosphodiesterase [Steroidobacteraceae bacterium]